MNTDIAKPEGGGVSGKSKDRISRRDLLRWAGIGGTAALATGSLGAIQSSAIVVERRTLRLPKWDADGFRVAVVSDIHVNDAVCAARAKKAVRLALDENPDLIVLPGDFINFSWSYMIDGMVNSLEDLHDAKCPVIGTLGNHDYWTFNPHDIIEAIKKRTNVKLLRNESTDVQGVTIAGIDDALVKMHRPAFVSDLKNKSVLVLFHEPDYVVETPKNASLQISGHSHGGQVCLPFGAPILTPFGAKRYKVGFYPEASVPLYVTRGVGTIGPPVRMFCPPEVSILTLRSAI